MAFLIIQHLPDGRRGRYYEVNPNTGDPTWDATMTVHATKFETYAQALAAIETMPEWMNELNDRYGIIPKVEPCRDPIHGLK